ncbi:MAG: hypothetical protein F9K16_07055 [Thermoanaerobaculia bacterium]|nr:MAG: hypothetical protein F9K16_07055 [Thermoanaerobaculia bacterium]MBZ0101417.1 hypothetical protein [Thermoanaerobaculia bacterium]
MSPTPAAKRKTPSKRWSVNKALKETIDEIRKGCSMPFAPGGRKALDQYYRKHYNKQQGKISWPAVRRKILILARLVGHVASLIELWRAHAAGQRMPKTVSKKALLMAADFVAAAKLCPENAVYPQGGLCPPPCKASGGCSAANASAFKKWLHGVPSSESVSARARTKK